MVFPGGKVDAGDSDAGFERLVEPVHPRAPLLEGDPRALAIAAAREGLEEAGILPLRGAPLEAAGGVERLRARSSEIGFQAALAEVAEAGARLALGALVPWARWVTPVAEARRFDARFYLLELPEGQVGRHDEHETTQSFWASPEDALAMAERGEIFLAPPTTRTLELLLPAASFADASAIAARQSLRPICPTFVPSDEGGYLALPGDPAHEVSERRVDGPTRFVLRDGRFVSAEA